jgi:thiol:disulfide interchange protein DsbD
MIPLTVSFFTRSGKKRIKGIRNAIIYGISIILIYVLLGTIVTALLGPSFLNSLSTNVWLNLIFFAILTIFAISFMGAFDISLPSSWQNKVDRASGKGGLIGIFFMAFALAIVSFSCTGPIVGTLLVESASIGGYAPLVGMFGFSLAIALPFTVFAIFPGWLSSMPKSGAWLNTVKVTLGFIELALALKFLSNADLVLQTHYLEREMFLSVWIAIFLSLSIYLFGFINLSHDTKPEKISVGRFMTGLFSLVFVIYLLPGIWGAPLKIISGFPPPLNYSEWKKNDKYKDEHGRHVGVHGIMMFDNLEEALVYAEKEKKPIMLDFTGWACANCRRMEELVWSNEQILPILKEKVIVVSLYTDDKNYLSSEEQKKTGFKTVGEKWTALQLKNYDINSQPLYRMLSHEGVDLSNGSASYQTHGNPNEFKKWLEKGLIENDKVTNNQ